MSVFEFKRAAKATDVDIGSVEELSRLDILDEDGRRRFTFSQIVSLFFAGGSTFDIPIPIEEAAAIDVGTARTLFTPVAKMRSAV